jgi:hypothetical protein
MTFLEDRQIMCPLCNKDVTNDPKHKFIPPDHLDCTVNKKILRLVNEEPIQISDNEMVNQIARITKILTAMSPQMLRFTNNQNNFNQRLQTMELEIKRIQGWIKMLSEDIVNINTFLETLPEFKKVRRLSKGKEKEEPKNEVKK